MLALLVLAASLATACPGLSVHDGDTIRCNGKRVRISDIDAPELPDSPKCQDRRRSYAWCDFALGYRSRDALRTFLSRGGVEVLREGYDRYGRTLATLRVNGRGAGQYLVSVGLGRSWR